jgi:hypothetical protein
VVTTRDHDITQSIIQALNPPSARGEMSDIVTHDGGLEGVPPPQRTCKSMWKKLNSVGGTRATTVLIIFIAERNLVLRGSG